MRWMRQVSMSNATIDMNPVAGEPGLRVYQPMPRPVTRQACQCSHLAVGIIQAHSFTHPQSAVNDSGVHKEHEVLPCATA